MAIFLAALTVVSTAIGGLLALKSKDRFHLVLGLSAGLLLGLVGFDLLPEVFGHSTTTAGVPTVSIAILIGLIAGVIGLITGGFLLLGFVIPLSYIIAVKFIGLFVARNVDFKTRLLIPIALTTMHMAWGWGFLTSPDRKSVV